MSYCKLKRTIFFPIRQRGVSLVITLIMLVVIGLTAAAAMRGAISSEQVVNNMRAESVAQQYAEAALKYCEEEMEKPSAGRIIPLQDANVTTVAGTPSWQVTTTWLGAGATRIELPLARIKSADSSFAPTVLPQCFVERQVLADGSTALIVTGRGFSTDYTADAATGRTRSGSVVWLQSVLAFN